MGNTASAPSQSSSSGRTATPASAPPGAAALPQGMPGVSGAAPPPRSPPSPAPPATPLLLPYAGHLSPQNPHCLSHPQANDYSKTIVCQLILDGELAPFYRGLDDFEDDWTEAQIKIALDDTRERDLADDVQNSFTQRLKEERSGGHKVGGGLAEQTERERRELKAYLGALECPICFLYYPPNINTSRCCQQPICTECFVQMKRSEATVTHLESDAACCPFCMETDFGVIYERPTPSGTPGPDMVVGAAHMLSASPDAGTSSFSHALSIVSEDALSTSPCAATSAFQDPSAPQPRRKSVSSKAKEVITIDQVRPDWETKLNAVKAAAARRAARRIVMRQVGDRLIPIGYTSSRATGQADFSMSIPPEEGVPGRRARRTRERERELEEMMIMEAMRLSMIDHEEHQRKIADDKNKERDGTRTRSGSGTPNHYDSQSGRSSAAGGASGSGRAGSSSERQSTASKLLSKITVGNRSRSNSKSSVHFAASPTTLGEGSSNSTTSPRSGSPAGASGLAAPVPSRARSSSSPSPNPMLAHPHFPSPLGSCVGGGGVGGVGGGSGDPQPTTRHSFDTPSKSRSLDVTTGVSHMPPSLACPTLMTSPAEEAGGPVERKGPADTVAAGATAAAGAAGAAGGPATTIDTAAGRGAHARPNHHAAARSTSADTDLTMGSNGKAPAAVVDDHDSAPVVQ